MSERLPSGRAAIGTFATLVFVAAVATGCSRFGDEGSSRRETSRESKPAACAGEEPRSGSEAVAYVRGRVVVPKVAERAADAGPRSGGAEAGRTGAVRQLRPVRDVEVVLHRGTAPEDGRRVASARADDDGEWCTSVSAGAVGPGLYASVTVDSVQLRRPVAIPPENRISVDTEALTRLLVERLGGVEGLSRAQLLNLASMSASAVDLLEPVAWEKTTSIRDGVERALRSLEADRRISERIEGLGGE
ncbi:MAG: hypothetical protein ABEL76_08220 [Bradymonadaceae bacterium]